MSEWVTKALAEICPTISAGGTPTSDRAEFYGGGIPFVTIEDITRAGRTIERTVRSLTPDGLAASAAWLVPPGHILYSMYASLGKVVINSIPVATNQAILALRPDSEQIDTTFLFYVLQSIEPTVKGLAAQTTQANLSAQIVRRFRVQFPREPKAQRRIAEILGTVDEAIEATEALIAKQQQVKAGLMHDLFTRGLTSDGNLRPLASAAPALYQETPLGLLPKEWTATTVADCLLGIEAGKSPECPDTPAVGDQWGVLKVGAIHPDGLREHENKVVLSLLLRTSSYLVAEGDLLFSRANTSELVGLSCHVLTQPRNLMLSDKTLRLRVRPEQMTTRFLFWALQTATSRRQIENAATGTSGSMKNISQSGVRGIGCARPKLDEQKQITDRIDTASAALAAEAARLAKLRQQKQGLMQALLTPPGGG